MREQNLAAADYPDHPIWQRISLHTIGPEDALLSFAARLSRENWWTDDYTARVIEEYRRFCFLAVTTGIEVTPSDQVDQAWHLHLTYSRDYWERFCPEVLGQSLHHCPTAGGPDERGRHFEQYAQTLRAYEQVFGAVPPADIWPSGAQRLIEDPKARRIHPRDGAVLSRRVARWILYAAVAIAIAHFIFW
ncbi:glycine-rich domain-containing protein [Sphingomonas sp. DBB INV C78]|uniref:glycine-rich domain-containing protein n=1 Tax=Sphingomonas sp. DBB INV C78 TaxID=3349434 RepID=UPI0036D271C0